jgi:hypothetical protein
MYTRVRRGRLATAICVALLLACVAPGPSPALCAAYRIAERLTPPEPLSPWAAVDVEIERLVARGELPFEAWSFRPADRGEVAAWLTLQPPRTSRASGATHSSRLPQMSPSGWRLGEALQWERQRWLDPGPLQMRSRDRPGTLMLFDKLDRMLFVAPYLRVMPAINSGNRAAWTDSSRLGFRAVFCAGSSIVISTGLFLAQVEEGRSFADPLIAGTDFILHEEEATISARVGPFRLRAGRDRHRWGPGVSGSLLLCDTGAPFNFMEYQLRLGDRVRFLALTGVTSRHAAAYDQSANPHTLRYLSAHRLMWNITPDLSVSFSEGARYQAGAPHVLYMVGFVPYTLVERLDIQDEPSDSTDNYLRNNVLWSVDCSWRPTPGCVLYGELLADDIATTSSEMPTRGGFQVGFTLAPRWQGWDWTVGAEFTKVSNYTYSVYYQDLCQCDWDHQGGGLGYGLGPDVEDLLLRCLVDPALRWGGGAWLRVTSKGEGAIGKPWKPVSTGCSPCCDPDCGEVSAWDLSGVVERTVALGVEARYRPAGWCWGGASYEVRRVTHAAHCAEAGPCTESTLRIFLSLGG